jgi:hypothetical protein
MRMAIVLLQKATPIGVLQEACSTGLLQNAIFFCIQNMEKIPLIFFVYAFIKPYLED